MNSEELHEQWTRVYETVIAYDSVDPSQASAFLSRLQPQAMSDSFLMLTADNDFIKKWIEGHYVEHIRRALNDIHGTEFVVAVEVDENQKAPEPKPQDGVAQPAGAESSAPAASPVAGPSAQPAGAAAPFGAQPGSAVTNFSAQTTGGAAAIPGSHPATAPYAQNASGAVTNPDALPGSAQLAGAATNLDALHAAGAQPVTPMSQAPASASNPHATVKAAGYHDNMLAPTSSLTFENFVIGASNRMAYSMAVSVAEEPGRPMLNPLFIYGKSGLGKTHLMRAIQNYVAETRPELQSVYVDSADFLSGYVEAAIGHDKQKTSFKTFKNRYQEADILLIDDIQYLQGKEQTLDIVFQIFNSMVDLGKQVVLSADRAPKNITMDERYQSRFNSGGTFDIQPPETETKLGIITSFIDEYRTTSGQPDFVFPDDIARYIADNSSSNIRELKSAVTKVIYSMNAFGVDEITIEKVSSLLENHFSGGAMKKLTIADIQKQVELYYDVPHSDLIGQKRDRKIAYARKIAIYLSREMLDLPYNYIAKSFGGRDHTTIMYSVTNVEKQMSATREIREEIENIKKRIKEM